MSKFKSVVILFSMAVLALTLTVGCGIFGKIDKAECENQKADTTKTEQEKCKKTLEEAKATCNSDIQQQKPRIIKWFKLEYPNFFTKSEWKIKKNELIKMGMATCTKPTVCETCNEEAYLEIIIKLQEKNGIICVDNTGDEVPVPEGVDKETAKHIPSKDNSLLICWKKKRKIRKSSYNSDSNYSIPRLSSIGEVIPDKKGEIWEAINKNKKDIAENKKVGAKNKGDIKTNKEEIKKIVGWDSPEAIAARKEERKKLKALENLIRDYHPKKPHPR